MKYFIVLVLLSMFVFLNNLQAEEWIFLGENENGRFFYDKKSVSGNRETEITVRMRQYISPNMSNIMDEVLPHLKGSKSLISYDIINCKSNEYKSDRIIYYDSSNKVVKDTKKDKHKYKEIGFRSIPNDTPVQRLRDIVCSKRLIM